MVNIKNKNTRVGFKALLGLIAFITFGIGNLYATVNVTNANNVSSKNTDYVTVANPEAVVCQGKARFTVLTSRLIRMEWSEDGVWEDRASLAIINRNLPVPEFKVKRGKNKLVITTKDVQLTYTGNNCFDANNLSVTFKMPVMVGDSSNKQVANTSKVSKTYKTVMWYPGADDSGNLKGTIRTLDGCKSREIFNGKGDPWENGLISRDGWAIIDESSRHLFVDVDSDWKQWVESRDGKQRQDWYILAYGHDYKDALKDFTKIAGKIPLPPKYMFGYWWSRYWQYSDFEFIQLAEEIRSHDIPLDVMVVDMDWHETFTLSRKNPPKDEFGQRIGWTGYTWQKQLFPDPERFLKDLHNMGLKTSLNIHPASGIQPYEDCYETFVKDYLSRTSDYDGPEGYIYDGPYQFAGPDKACGKAGDKAVVPFRICQQEWTDAYFNSVIHPLEKQGVDFWWLDWQQWKESKYTDGLSNTFWLNYCFFSDKQRQSVSEGIYAERPVIYHRWGGLGSHRYQIGFSGDAYEEWDVLRFLPEFTASASNVGYGYWGHDIGGHTQAVRKPSDGQMFTRWLQYSVFTPIFKTHCTKNRWIERRIWAFPEYFNTMRAAIRLRYDLSPYIYDAARAAYDSGVSICRPMYYEYPESDNAYDMREQFFFGDNIMATVLCEPMDSITGLTNRTVWFPEGTDWYDMATGKLYKGGSIEELKYTIEENPWYVKAAAVVPMAASDIMSLQEESNELRIMIAPGVGSCQYTHYQDDASTQAYVSEYALTKINHICDGKENVVTVGAAEGKYRGMQPTRKLSFVFERVFAPEKVLLGTQEIKYSYEAERLAQQGIPAWTYDGANLRLMVYLPESSTTEQVDLQCIYSEQDIAKEHLLDGAKGLINRMMNITPETKIVFADNVDAYKLLPIPFLNVAQAGSKISVAPKTAATVLEEIDTELMVKTFNENEKLPEAYKKRIEALVIK